MRAFLALAAIAVALVVASRAFAMDFETALARGLVGERADGLAGTVKTSAALSALVNSVNAARLAEFRAAAEGGRWTPATVRAIAGARRIAEAQARGWYWMDAGGHWERK
jgi:uncharacterized protein YdbL (DUF1318 family)